ncbi:MAG: hypothetical protein RIC35_12635 [Marinoscillum sp.]
MNRIILGLILSLLAVEATSQKYGTTFGVRVGNDEHRKIGVSLEQRLFKHLTLEGIVQSDFNRNTTAHGLMKKHYPVLTKRLTLITGAGVAFGNEESNFENPTTKEVITTYGNETLGVDLMVGAELSLLGFNVSLDYKPNFNLYGRDDWYMGQVGISVRTIIIKDKDRKKNKRQRARIKRKKEREKLRDSDY